MLVWWYLIMIAGSLCVDMIYCQDNSPLSIDNEPDATVILSVDTRPKSSVDATNSAESFACHECINCHKKSNLTTRICHPDINMCFTMHRRINNTNQIIRRGCSTSKRQCLVPYDDDDQLNSFDTITCCTSHKCNQGIQYRPMFFLLIFNLFIMIIRI